MLAGRTPYPGHPEGVGGRTHDRESPVEAAADKLHKSLFDATLALEVAGENLSRSRAEGKLAEARTQTADRDRLILEKDASERIAAVGNPGGQHEDIQSSPVPTAASWRKVTRGAIPQLLLVHSRGLAVRRRPSWRRAQSEMRFSACAA